MDNFEQLKHIWQRQTPSNTVPDIGELKKSNADNQRKLEREQIRSAFWLLVTSIFLLTTTYFIWIGFFFDIRFLSILTYDAIILVALISALQAFINISLYRRLRRIEVTAPVAQHLTHWQQYYDFRKRLVRVNIPLYYVLLNIAFGLYFIEILGHFSLLGRIMALSSYSAWVFFAYFILSKRTLRKENKRLETIICNLRAMQQQISNESNSGL